MSIMLYMEGGGDKADSRSKCRKGLLAFLSKAGLAGRMPRVVACGSRESAFEQFSTALKANTDDFVVLLVDSEGPVTGEGGAWAHLNQSDGWSKPAGAADENAHLMVQCMEAWFMADKDALTAYFGTNFNPNPLPQNPSLEDVPKADVLDGLKNATRPCKNQYDKNPHSFKILARIDPGKVAGASSHAERFIRTLQAKA